MNLLSTETSTYLLQHAKNPVFWKAWNDESLNYAAQNNKPIILSIGYSACHWCHVMEHESFENEQVAKIMNDHFVCIKVDREERPDVDCLYMDAVQTMGVRGGWPLNVFLMPDTKPFYGGTYFPPSKWANLCLQIANAFQNNFIELSKSANSFAESLKNMEVFKIENVDSDEFKKLELADYKAISKLILDNADFKWGGIGGAPKFPMPCVTEFLLNYSSSFNDLFVSKYLTTTLERMAFGGIFDQIAGGFSRYSVDGEWFCPHFEKMLYDNAQLLSLYAKAYLKTKNLVYLNVLNRTIFWLNSEMQSLENGFYSAQDADSEGEEGKYYVWTELEIQTVLGEQAKHFLQFFQVEHKGNWKDDSPRNNEKQEENGKNILWSNMSLEEYCLTNNIDSQLINNQLQKLYEVRNKRVHPGLDDKILTSWNSLMITGLVDVYKTLGDENIKNTALLNADFLIKNVIKEEGYLNRTYKNGIAKIEGFLEDYATTITAFVGLYQICFDEKYLSYAESIAVYCIDNFFDASEGLFYFSNVKSSQLIANKQEIFDNVIPSGNALMAEALLQLGRVLEKSELKKIAISMISKIQPLLRQNPQYLAKWASLTLSLSIPHYEIVILGKKHLEFSKQIHSYNLPNYILCAAETKSSLPIFNEKRCDPKETLIFVCFENTCQLPVNSVEKALALLTKFV